MELKSIVEALLFTAGRVLSTNEILDIFKERPEGMQPTSQDLKQALETLEQEWGEGRPIVLARVAEGYEFRTDPAYAPWLQLLNRSKPQRLSAPAVETLALTAYRQPVTRVDIESIRGVDSGGVLKNLLERRLIRIVGRKEEPGRPILYATTSEFLELFGLQDLADLPPLQEFEEMIKKQGEEVTSLSVSDLISTPEEIASMEDEDREAMQELDQSLNQLKEQEKKINVVNDVTNEGGES
jgi:segregation and condensation protein B